MIFVSILPERDADGQIVFESHCWWSPERLPVDLTVGFADAKESVAKMSGQASGTVKASEIVITVA